MTNDQLSFISYLLRNTSYVRDDVVWAEPNPWYYARSGNSDRNANQLTSLEKTCLSALSGFSRESRYTHLSRVIPTLKTKSQDSSVWTLAERLIPYVLSHHIATWIMVERQRYHDVSSFALFYDGLYLCDALQPSLHANIQSWRIGGRGGLPTGMYTLKSYWWRDKQKPVWQLTGDYRRGSILLHSGNSVADSKGCILLGVMPDSSSSRLTSSQIATSAVWTVLRRLKPGAQIVDSSPSEGSRFIILRTQVYNSE
jgi:hypothetical protein